MEPGRDPQVTDEFGRHAESVAAQRTYGQGNLMTELNAEHARRAIVEYTRRLAASAAAAGPDAAVPTTPGWTITDLVEHVGQTQHWVAEIIERRITDPTQLPTGMAVLPTDPRQWQAWLSESAQRVASACSDGALDVPVFNPAGDERPGTRFWMSSLLNEAVVHGFDAANRPRPALARQHRPCRRLTGTEAPTATTKTMFGRTPVPDAVIGEATDGAGDVFAGGRST
jgi:uncharacterized protein (TIGR03083 family)